MRFEHVSRPPRGRRITRGEVSVGLSGIAILTGEQLPRVQRRAGPRMVSSVRGCLLVLPSHGRGGGDIEMRGHEAVATYSGSQIRLVTRPIQPVSGAL